MSFVTPLWLAVAGAVGLGLVIAHLFSTSVPPRDYLPTVRFVPEGAPMAVMRTRRLSDITLLLLRLLAVVLFGLALAGAHVKRAGPPRVVLVDVSRAVRSFAEVRDSARPAQRDGAVMIAFDSTARRVPPDSLDAMSVGDAPGALSAAIVAAHRALLPVTADRDETELVIVSPLVREEIDSATAGLLALWPGTVRHIRVATADAPTAQGVAIGATGDDPVTAAVELQIPRSARDDNRTVIPSEARNLQLGTRIVRTTPTRADSLWARDSGGALVVWPADERSDLLPRRAPVDTTTGIAAGRHVVVANFARTHQPRPGRTLARWIDGAPAATEIRLGRGCVREVAIPVDPVGDVALRESFRGIVRTITEPCGGARDLRASVIPSEARDLQVKSRNELQHPLTRVPARFARDDNSLPLLLGAFALGVLLLEQFLRARGRAVA